MFQVLDKFVNELNELRYNKHRIWVLAKEELKLEFGQSRLGFLWTFLEPLGIILVYATIFPLILGADFYSWVLYFIAGLIPHRFLQEGIVTATQSVVHNRDILNRISVKEEIIPISSVLSCFIKFMAESAVFFSIIFFAGVLPTFLIFIFFLLVIFEFLIVTGFGMHLSMSYIRMRDLDHILKVFFQALFFLTPIVYRLSKIPAVYQKLYLLNPISRLILLYQTSLLSGLPEFAVQISTPLNLLLLGFFSVMTFLIGYSSFKRRKTKYMGQL